MVRLIQVGSVFTLLAGIMTVGLARRVRKHEFVEPSKAQQLRGYWLDTTVCPDSGRHMLDKRHALVDDTESEIVGDTCKDTLPKFTSWGCPRYCQRVNGTAQCVNGKRPCRVGFDLLHSKCRNATSRVAGVTKTSFSAGTKPIEGSLAVLGVVRNVGEVKVSEVRSAVEDLGTTLFEGRYHVFLFENDSEDCSESSLLDWARANPKKVSIKSGHVNVKKFQPSKSQRRRGLIRSQSGDYLFTKLNVLSFARNQVLQMMRNYSGPKFDYILNVDFDMAQWQATTVATAFSQESSWDMVCANGVMSENDSRYYDAFAYRSAQFPESVNTAKDVLRQKYGVESFFGPTGYVSKIHVGASQPPQNAMVPVDSCFGGMALYRGNLFQDNECKYQSPDQDCEHVHLHRCLLENNPAALFYMLPSLRIVYDLSADQKASYRVRGS